MMHCYLLAIGYEVCRVIINDKTEMSIVYQDEVHNQSFLIFSCGIALGPLRNVLRFIP